METKNFESDILIIGGGMAGCGAAYEARCWGKNLDITIVEKANIERSGAVAMGLSAINTYLGTKWGENTPEDYLNYVRGDLMGMIREDLVYDIGRHVDSSVELFEKWGLPIMKSSDGKYLREGRWQILIHGESYKAIVAEAAQKAATTVINRVMITHLLTDPNNPNRISGAVGFDVRDGSFNVFKAKAVIVASGGATHIFRPRSVGEGWGRTWYSPWSTGSAYALPMQAGAKMVQMEIRLIPTRFKDGYGPVGSWFLYLKTVATNSKNQRYEDNRDILRKEYGSYADLKPLPTCLRNHLMIEEIRNGNGPILMHTEKSLDSREKEEAGWEDFLDMTVSQAGLWASQNIDPKEKPSELVPTEPYIMGSHAVNAGAWVSGPGDLAPPEYFWGYNRMTTIDGLFAAGDAAGGAAHKFSSGSFAEGMIAGKSAVKYIRDHSEDKVEIDSNAVDRYKIDIFQPLDNYTIGRSFITQGTVSPYYLYPNMGLKRLEKIMDEYAGGLSTMYTTSEANLTRGLELLTMLKEDLQLLGAEDLHQLQRAWELVHRVWTAEAVIRHTMYRKETRWPGYYYRSDYPKIDDENWKVFVVSRYDPATDTWEFEKAPVLGLEMKAVA
ncbi:MAG: adenylyl-sulfate reductase subunit alpha [Thermoplasmata archaeon]